MKFKVYFGSFRPIEQKKTMEAVAHKRAPEIMVAARHPDARHASWRVAAAAAAACALVATVAVVGSSHRGGGFEGKTALLQLQELRALQV